MNKHRQNLISVVNFFIFPLVLTYWFIFRPKYYGAVCVIKSGNEILLAKHSYGRKRWGLPGGSLKKRETPRDGIIREIHEEVGVRPKEIVEGGRFTEITSYVHNVVYWFIADVDSKDFFSDNNEITQAKWFNIDNLPTELGPISKRAIDLYKHHV